MAEIIKTYLEHFPAVRLVGKCYTNADRGPDGGFSNRWGEWFNQGWFGELEKLTACEEVDNGYIGLSIYNGDMEKFQYWIGIFYPAEEPVPEGYKSINFPEGDVAVNWIYGKETGDNIYGMHDACEQKLKENGWQIRRMEPGGSVVSFERYNCPRFLEPDEQGKIILDYGIYMQ